MGQPLSFQVMNSIEKELDRKTEENMPGEIISDTIIYLVLAIKKFFIVSVPTIRVSYFGNRLSHLGNYPWPGKFWTEM